MRSILVLLFLVTGLSVAQAIPAAAGDGAGRAGDRAAAARQAAERPAAERARAERARVVLPAQASPRAALAVAGRVLDGEARTGDPSATVALRDLWVARPDLTGAAETEADALLARPTEGAADPFDHGYAAPATRTCGPHVCVHHVTSTADAPPSQEWVDLTVATLEETYAEEVGRLGYRAPLGDGATGGDSRLDVYLKDLGTGLYGYCAAEYRRAGRTASGFCVLDNDYAATQFPSGTSPQDNLTVTAAHEFFHAVQYAYDYAEDPWMMESTATWMEERVADAVDDNRQYLAHSQLGAPYVPLDAVSSTYGFQYGNWIFWEYLTQRYSRSLVKRAWKKVGSLPSDGGTYSVQGLRSVLRSKGGLPRVYADFVAANTVPDRAYSEGAAYGTTAPLGEATLTRGARRYATTARLDHLTGDSLRIRPGAGLRARRWRLQVAVDAPSRMISPAATLLVHRTDGRLSRVRVPLDRRGNATTTVPFGAKQVRTVTVSLVNASIRYRCRRGTSLACAGVPRDDDQRYRVVARAVSKRG